MGKFFERYNLPRWNQEGKKKNMDRQTSSTEMELVILKLPRNKSPGPVGVIGEFCQTLATFLLNLLQKVMEEGTHSNSFYEAKITLISKWTKISQTHT